MLSDNLNALFHRAKSFSQTSKAIWRLVQTVSFQNQCHFHLSEKKKKLCKFAPPECVHWAWLSSTTTFEKQNKNKECHAARNYGSSAFGFCYQVTDDNSKIFNHWICSPAVKIGKIGWKYQIVLVCKVILIQAVLVPLQELKVPPYSSIPLGGLFANTLQQFRSHFFMCCEIHTWR